MPWYISFSRVAMFCGYSAVAAMELNWIRTAEDRYRRSLSWSPTVATIVEHKIVANKFASSHIWYKFHVDGSEYVAEQFRSGGLNVEERLKNPTLLGAGTELVVYYNPADPSEAAVKLQQDREGELFYGLNALLCIAIAYRCLRCETLFPSLLYRFLNVNRRFAERTGMKSHSANSRRRAGMDHGGTPQRERLASERHMAWNAGDSK